MLKPHSSECLISFSSTLPHSQAFPRRRPYSEWSYPRKIEPRENMDTLQRLMTRLSFCKKLFLYIYINFFQKEKERPYLCSNHRCHSCPWEWSRASSLSQSSDPNRRDNKQKNTFWDGILLEDISDSGCLALITRFNCFIPLLLHFRENGALLYLITSQCVNQMSRLAREVAKKTE